MTTTPTNSNDDGHPPKEGSSSENNSSNTTPVNKPAQPRRQRRSEETLGTLIQVETRHGRWFEAQDLWHEYIQTYPTAYNYVKFASWAEDEAKDVILARAIYESLLRTDQVGLKAADVKQPSILRKWASFEKRQGEVERANVLQEQIRQLLLQQSSKYKNLRNDDDGNGDDNSQELQQPPPPPPPQDYSTEEWSRTVLKLQSVFPQSAQIMDAQQLEEKASSRVWSSSSTVSSNTVTTSDALDNMEQHSSLSRRRQTISSSKTEKEQDKEDESPNTDNATKSPESMPEKIQTKQQDTETLEEKETSEVDNVSVESATEPTDTNQSSTESTDDSMETLEFSQNSVDSSVGTPISETPVEKEEATTEMSSGMGLSEQELRQLEQEEQELRRLESVFPQAAQKLTAEQLEAMASSIWSQKEPDDSNWLGQHANTDIGTTYMMVKDDDNNAGSSGTKLAQEEKVRDSIAEQHVDRQRAVASTPFPEQLDLPPPQPAKMDHQKAAKSTSFPQQMDIPPPEEEPVKPAQKMADWVTSELRNLPPPNNPAIPKKTVAVSSEQDPYQQQQQQPRQQQQQQPQQYNSIEQSAYFVQSPPHVQQEQLNNFHNQQQEQYRQQQLIHQQQLIQQRQHELMQQQMQQQWEEQQRQQQWVQQQQQYAYYQQPGSSTSPVQTGTNKINSANQNPSAGQSGADDGPLPYWLEEEEGASDSQPHTSNDGVSDQAVASILQQQQQQQRQQQPQQEGHGLLEDLGQNIMGFFQKPKLADLVNRRAPIDDDQEQALLAALEAMNAAGSDEAAIMDAADLISKALEDKGDQ